MAANVAAYNCQMQQLEAATEGVAPELVQSAFLAAMQKPMVPAGWDQSATTAAWFPMYSQYVPAACGMGLSPYAAVHPFVPAALPAMQQESPSTTAASGYIMQQPWGRAAECQGSMDGQWMTGGVLKEMQPDDNFKTATTRRRGARKGKKAAAAAAMAACSNFSVKDYMQADSPELSENGENDENCPYRARWGEAYELCESQEKSQEVLDFLGTCTPAEQHKLLMWMLRYVHPLALSKQGTYVVQKMLETVNKADKERITVELKPCIKELYESAHGNHVLAKVVEQLPSATLQFIVREFSGRGREVARHQYGCRIMERLIEHCRDEGDMASLLAEVVRDAESLCRHPFGNFVVQHLLEHGSNERRRAILNQVEDRLPALSMHRTASHFVQQLLDYSEPGFQEMIIRKLLDASEEDQEGKEVTLGEIAGSRYGSFVIEQVASVSEMYDEVREALQEVLPRMNAAQLKFARRVMDKYNLKGYELSAPYGTNESMKFPMHRL
mmetsp:Transcript_18090/g.42264  ORF Transcript_18090/g.42264 Transcript_18090/m.42264 type:complete len:499 (+) Transcript_18090:132-1628(+)|eukprot:CAMPEP_0178399768 /NCGR_PEP_ID=MMETSP0689_2-20121128/15447_1 /TAXON_ID=160604 /ORGANISM="Amphidinium massartii, Strain CS-259" /LENGTH=498 /DNA_ID=CAMNT_0020020549 /DNA_START=121 /DNA_END=1617 /DNA_ORIENTATION=-